MSHESSTRPLGGLYSVTASCPNPCFSFHDSSLLQTACLAVCCCLNFRPEDVFGQIVALSREPTFWNWGLGSRRDVLGSLEGGLAPWVPGISISWAWAGGRLPGKRAPCPRAAGTRQRRKSVHPAQRPFIPVADLNRPPCAFSPRTLLHPSRK